MPNDDLVFDDFRNVKLKSVEHPRIPFFSDFDEKSVQGFEERAVKGETANFDGPTGAQMRRRNTGCGCTVVSYNHRRNNIAIQQRVAPVIAYSDAPETTPTQPSAPKISTA